MRAVGPQTQAQIDAQEFQRALRVVVYDESGAEIPIPFDAIPSWPIVQANLDGVSWRMTIEVRTTPETEGVLLRGRTIQAWEIFAAGEDLELFKGKIADPKETKDYSQGSDGRASITAECVGRLSSTMDAFMARYKWSPAAHNPEASNPYAPTPSDFQKLTAILKRYRMTLLNPGTATFSATLTSSPTVIYSGGSAIGTAFALTTVAGLTIGDSIYLFKNHRAHRLTIKDISPGTSEVLVHEQLSGTYAAGDPCARGGFVGLPINFAWFGTTTLESWVEAWKADGTSWSQPGNWELYVEVWTGVPTLRLITSPGERFSVDVKAVDRWVLLKRRKYNTGSGYVYPTPYFQLLDGVAGQAGSERLNDQAKTTLRGDKTKTSAEIWVTDPAGIFASTTGSNAAERWASVWIGGVEYFGKVATVDKTIGSPTYGKITFDAAYPLRNAAGVLAAPAGGEEVANTSTAHFEILDPSVRVMLQDSAGNLVGPMMIPQPRGGWFMIGYREDTIWSIVPDYDQELYWLPGSWQYLIYQFPIAIEDAATRPQNDVSATLEDLLLKAGYDPGDVSLDPTGYTMAPFSRAQFKLLDLVDEIRKGTIPPSWKLRETEGGNAVGGYIAQAAEPQIQLRNVRNFQPRELPQALTRVIVKGKTIETNRAGQLMHSVEGIQDLNRLFDGFSEDSEYGKRAAVTTQDPARAVFRIPKCEPGRYPLATKIVTQSDSMLKPWVGSCDTYHRTTGTGTVTTGNTSLPVVDASGFYVGQRIKLISMTYAGVFEERTIQAIVGNTLTIDPIEYEYYAGEPVLPALTYLEQPFTLNNVGQTYTTHEFVGLEEILAGKTSPEGECFLVVEWNIGDGSTTGFYVDELELYVKEGAYWEARFVDGGGSEFGTDWTQPDRTLSMSERTAPTAWLQRNMADYATGQDRVLVVEAEGITVAQAREVAEAYLEAAIRGSEFFECLASYDPRVQQGDTVGVLLPDGTAATLLVWGIVKQERDMKLLLANYGR